MLPSGRAHQLPPCIAPACLTEACCHAAASPPPATQLHPWAFEEAAKGKLAVESRMQEGYDHRRARV